MILTKVLLGLTEEATSSTYNSIEASADSSDIDIWMLALRCAYVYDRDTISADTLRKYAFKPYNPGVSMDYVTQSALVNLINAEILVNNYEGAVRAIDSVLYREAPEEVKRKYLAYRAEIMYSDAGDTTYASVIDSLISLYPNDKDINTAKYMISYDTVMVQSFERISQEQYSSVIPEYCELSAYPSPARNTQTIEIHPVGTILNIDLYDFWGRELCNSVYRYSVNGGVVNMQFNLPSGYYYVKIDIDNGFRISRLVVDSK
jgi:hypothetical protein